MYYKLRSYDVWLLFFALLPPSQSRKSKSWKNEESAWRYYHFTNVYYKWQSNHVWFLQFLRYGVWQNFLTFWVIFSPFYLTINNTQNQNFRKMKKKPRDIIILHMCTITDYHIMYGSWDMECLRQIFLSFWTIFW